MIIKGKTRGNGKQLAEYLMAWGENEKKPQVLELKQTPANDIHKSLLRMSLLSGEAKGLYHTTLNPESKESHDFSQEQWQQAADILEKHLKLEGMPRVIVVHEKAGRVHAHVVWQRFDPSLGKLRSDQFDKYRSSDARLEIEKALSLQKTNEKHAQKRDVKTELTQLWNEVDTAQQFKEKAEELGYILSRGEARRPFKVIAPDGQSLDLVRQLKGITTEQVRSRFKMIEKSLPSERQAVAQYRKNKEENPERQPEQCLEQGTTIDKYKLFEMFQESSKVIEKQEPEQEELDKEKRFGLFMDNVNEQTDKAKTEQKQHLPANDNMPKRAAANDNERPDKKQVLMEQFKETASDNLQTETQKKFDAFMNEKEKLLAELKKREALNRQKGRDLER
jgi:hypothetical protein